MSTVGDILSTVRDILSTVRDILSTVGDILSTVGDTQYRGGYHDACGGYHEYSGEYHEYSGEYHEYSGGVQYHGGTQIARDLSPHGTEHPQRCSRYPPMALMIFPTALNTLYRVGGPAKFAKTPSDHLKSGRKKYTWSFKGHLRVLRNAPKILKNIGDCFGGRRGDLV